MRGCVFFRRRYRHPMPARTHRPDYRYRADLYSCYCRGISPWPPSGSLKRRVWPLGWVRVSRDRARAAVSLGVTSTDKTTMRRATSSPAWNCFGPFWNEPQRASAQTASGARARGEHQEQNQQVDAVHCRNSTHSPLCLPFCQSVKPLRLEPPMNSRRIELSGTKSSPMGRNH